MRRRSSPCSAICFRNENNADISNKKGQTENRPRRAAAGGSLQGRDFWRRRLFAAAAGVKQIAQSALLADAISDGEREGQVAAVEDIVQDAALRAEQDKQKDKYPQAVIAAEISETVH